MEVRCRRWPHRRRTSICVYLIIDQTPLLQEGMDPGIRGKHVSTLIRVMGSPGFMNSNDARLVLNGESVSHTWEGGMAGASGAGRDGTILRADHLSSL